MRSVRDRSTPAKRRTSFRSLVRMDNPGRKTPAGGSAEKNGAQSADREALYDRAIGYVTRAFAAVRQKQSFDLDEGFRLIQQMADYPPLKDDPLLVCAFERHNFSNYLPCHSVNVCILALKLTESLEWGPDRRIETALTGLFHDAGMAALPDKLINSPERFRKHEIREVQKHAELGRDILKSIENGNDFLSTGALQVHERLDGAGYPDGLKGDAIHPYAQIIGLADMYEALTHPRPYRKKLSAIQAVREILQTGKTGFSHAHLKALLNRFSVFPISTLVKLNTNAVGKVIRINPGQPVRPEIQLLYDAHGGKIPEARTVNLLDHSLLNIVGAISEEELAESA